MSLPVAENFFGLFGFSFQVAGLVGGRIAGLVGGRRACGLDVERAKPEDERADYQCAQKLFHINHLVNFFQ